MIKCVSDGQNMGFRTKAMYISIFARKFGTHSLLGKVAGKKIRKKCGLLPNQGGGVSEGKQKTKPQVWKCVFSVSIENHSGTPKTCFTLGLECLGHF